MENNEDPTLVLLGLIGSFLVKKIVKAILAAIWSEALKAYYRALGYEVATVLANILAGVFLGGISLGIIPRHITPTLEIRVVNLIVTPLIVGALVNLSSNIKFHRKILAFDTVNFISGYTFTLA